MITITEQWSNFVSLAYPHVAPNSEQYRQLKSTWFAASLDLLSVLQHNVSKLTEDEGVEVLDRLFNESQVFLSKHIEEEFKRTRN